MPQVLTMSHVCRVVDEGGYAAIGWKCLPTCFMPQGLTMSHVCRVVDEDGYASEDTFYVTAEERVSLKMHNKNVPYATSVVRCQTSVPLTLVSSLSFHSSVRQGALFY